MKNKQRRHRKLVRSRKRVRRIILSDGGVRVIIKICGFSNPLSNTKSKTVYYNLVLDTLNKGYEIEVNANRRIDENGRYVCIKTHNPIERAIFRGTFCISVIDALGNERFQQSFISSLKVPQSSQEYDDLASINYIKRETLLADPAELLPSDTLTLQIDFYVLKWTGNDDDWFNRDVLHAVALSLGVEKGNKTDDVFYLNLDSELANILCTESLYFQRILETPMLEKTTRRMYISGMEYYAFQNIAELLINVACFRILCVEVLYEIYIVADKYDIPFITETCVCFLKLCLSDHTHEQLLERATRYENEALTECIQNLLMHKPEGNKGSSFLKERSVNSDWYYKHIPDDQFGNHNIIFENRSKIADFEFYN